MVSIVVVPRGREKKSEKSLLFLVGKKVGLKVTIRHEGDSSLLKRSQEILLDLLALWPVDDVFLPQDRDAVGRSPPAVCPPVCRENLY